MKFRLLVALCAVAMFAGCDALDTDNTPYEGMQPGDAIPGLSLPGSGAYTGYYSGEMTAESNSCQLVSDEVGATFALVLEIKHMEKEKLIEVDFDAENIASGILEGKDVTVMVNDAGVKHVYYLTFGEAEITGTVEVIEPNQDGIYGDSCAVYSISLKKGDKPIEPVASE